MAAKGAISLAFFKSLRRRQLFSCPPEKGPRRGVYIEAPPPPPPLFDVVVVGGSVVKAWIQKRTVDGVDRFR